MTISTSADFDLTRDQIIKEAYQKAGAVREGGTPTTTQYTEGALRLNMLVKSMHGKAGAPLWTVKVGYVLPQTGTNSFSCGPSGAHVTNSYVHTALNGSASSGAVTITVDSASGILASDQIGIELSDSTMYWTTVSGAPSGNTVTLTAGLTGAASDDADVYVYTTKVQRPVRVISAYLTDVANNQDTILTPIGREDYLGLSSKTTADRPTQFYYDQQLTNGVLYLWPRFNNGNYIVTINYHRPLSDFDASGDNPDFNQAWLNFLVYGLAYYIAPNYGMPIEDRRALRSDRDYFLEEAMDSDTEYSSLFLEPNTDG